MHRTVLCAAILVVANIGVARIALARETSPFRAGVQPDGKKGPAQPENRAKIIDEIRTDLDSAVEKLNRQDPSRQTRAVQDRILENLKKLLEPDDDSPPPNNSTNPPPKPKSPPPNSQDPAASEQPKPQPENQRQSNSQSENQPHSKPQPQTAPKAAPKQASSELSPPSANEDSKKQNRKEDGVWDIQMPRRHRQAMDAASGDGPIRRYEELLREYYRALAENTKRE
jgi:hypothetical protein